MKNKTIEAIREYFNAHPQETVLNVTDSNTYVSVKNGDGTDTVQQLSLVALKDDDIIVRTYLTDKWLTEADINYDMRFLVYDAVLYTLQQQVLN